MGKKLDFNDRNENIKNRHIGMFRDTIPGYNVPGYNLVRSPLSPK